MEKEKEFITYWEEIRVQGIKRYYKSQIRLSIQQGICTSIFYILIKLIFDNEEVNLKFVIISLIVIELGSLTAPLVIWNLNEKKYKRIKFTIKL